MNSLRSKEGREICYYLYGSGQPLVFLHGFLGDSSIWLNIVEKLKNKYLLLLVDLPGHGKNNPIKKGITMLEMASSVKQIIDKENISNPIVLGHSMGGYVALELAHLMPIKPVLIHSNFWADSLTKKEDRNRVAEVIKINFSLFLKTAIPNLFFKNNLILLKDEVNALILDASNLDSNSMSAVTIGMRDRQENTNVLLNQRVAIIQGVYDPIIPLAKMESELEKHKIQADYYLIDNCGHMGFLEQPSKFFDVIQSVINNFFK